MVDKKNLNRVKGILRAKQGAELPKYTVKQGDTLSQIVLNYNKLNNTNFNWQDIAAWNSIADPNNIQIGQTLSFVNPQQNNTVVAGANQAEGNPEAAVEQAAAQQAQQNAEVVSQKVEQQASEQAQQTGNTDGNTASNQGTDKKVTSTELSTGMVLTPEEAAQLKKYKGFETGAQLATAAFQGIGTAVGASQQASDSNLTKGVDQVYNTAAQAVENLGPVGKIVGTAMQNAKIAGDLIQGLGGGTDQQTTTDKWMDSAFFSWNIGMLNGFAGKKSDSFAVDQDILAEVGSSYGGTVDAMGDAAEKAGKKYGLFSSKARKKANKAIADAKAKQSLMGDIADSASDQRLAVQSMGEQTGLAYSLMTDGGYNQKYTYAAKQGGILEWNLVETLEWEPQVILNWELPEFKEGGSIELQEELEWIPEFKNGGKTDDSDIPEIEETNQKNVIPEGALHKNKHHMEHAEGLTKKGIPVIDDDGEQQAEIEHSEIIFTLEVTKKLEEYYEIFYSEESSTKEKEQAAIDAGKLLVFQILENTEDRTGLIESCKKGGTLTLKKTTDDLIDEVLEWAPTLVIVEETEVVEKPKKESEKKSDKEIMKEAIKEVLIELLTK